MNHLDVRVYWERGGERGAMAPPISRLDLHPLLTPIVEANVLNKSIYTVVHGASLIITR